MRRGRHEFRLSVWTFIAPIALVAAAFVVVGIAREVIDERSAVQAKLVSGTQATSADTADGADAGDEELESTAEDDTSGGTTTAGAAKRKTYVIKAGDTLSAIAVRFETTEERLLDLNPELDPLGLRPGERIRVS